MLDLTKVINELKDVLIQQVTTTNGSSEATASPSLTSPTARQTAYKLVYVWPLQVKETSFLRNTISECQACGKMSNNSHL